MIRGEGGTCRFLGVGLGAGALRLAIRFCYVLWVLILAICRLSMVVRVIR